MVTTETTKRNLVYTSAGDRSNLEHWLRGRRDFDLWVTYYGDVPGRYETAGEYYNERKGSKLNNLKFAYETWPERFPGYDAVFVMDDDILISTDAINRLFKLRAEYDLWILQPAFSPLGKISWGITRAQWNCRLRFTNFVETTCPLFRRDKLDAFIKIYDPALISYGTDWWFMEVLGNDIEGKVAIIDAIPCINPHDRTKGGVREIGRLVSHEKTVENWEEIKARYGLSRKPNREFGRVLKPIPERWLSVIAHIPIEGYVFARRQARIVRDAIRRLFKQRQPG